MRAQLLERFVHWGAKLGQDHVVDLSLLSQLSDTALTSEREIEMNAGGLPNTFVPVRNLLFFTVAASVADRRGLSVLIGGMCETDYSGYPDCRDNTLKSLQVAISLGLDKSMTIETPLMWLDKAATWAMTEDLGGEPLIELRDRAHPLLLSRRPRAPPCLGLGLRPVPVMRPAAQGLRQPGWRADAAHGAGRGGGREVAHDLDPDRRGCRRRGRRLLDRRRLQPYGQPAQRPGRTLRRDRRALPRRAMR